MNTLLLLILLQHPILAAKAGYLTYLNGMTSVKLDEFIRPGELVRTFKHTKIEAMLNPGSYLRVDESTEFVLESAALDRIAIRLKKGSIVIEAADVTQKNAITVRSEDLEFRIVKPGFYRFSEGSASVHEGKLLVPMRDNVVEKGWKLIWLDSAVEKKLIEKWESHPLEGWSQYRSAQIYAKSAPVIRKAQMAGSVYGIWRR
ncbi:MAG: hypothetical protein HY646_15435 [Acidobacteria bacterium]|nr:hypothetical protein [Acidobacteriota bacterium]